LYCTLNNFFYFAKDCCLIRIFLLISNPQLNEDYLMTTCATTIILEQRSNLEKFIIPNFISLDNIAQGIDFDFRIQHTLGILKLMANYENVQKAIYLLNSNSQNIEILFEFENCKEVKGRKQTTTTFRFLDPKGNNADQLHELYFVDETQCKFEVLN